MNLKIRKSLLASAAVGLLSVSLPLNTVQAQAKAPAAKAPAAKSPSAGAKVAAAPVAKEAGDATAAATTTAAPVKLELLPGGVSEEDLGKVIDTLGLKPEKTQQRYDFAFRAPMDDQEWTLSMSAVLSQDGESIWIMAWLDELPKSADDVPRSALLRLLAENDRMGTGKMFSYIAANRRFVLQRSLENRDMTSAKFKLYLQDLGSSVVETYSIWNTANWSAKAGAAANTADATPAPKGPAAGGPAPKAAANDSKFAAPPTKK